MLAELSPAEKRVYPGRSGAAHCGEYLHICNNAAHTPGSIVSMQIKTAPGIFTRCDRVTGTGGEGWCQDLLHALCRTEITRDAECLDWRPKMRDTRSPATMPPSWTKLGATRSYGSQLIQRVEFLFYLTFFTYLHFHVSVIVSILLMKIYIAIRVARDEASSVEAGCVFTVAPSHYITSRESRW